MGADRRVFDKLADELARGDVVRSSDVSRVKRVSWTGRPEADVRGGRIQHLLP